MAQRRVKLSDIEKGILVETDVVHQVIVESADAFRLELETAFFNTDSAVFLPEVPALPSEGDAQTVDFSNESLWKEIKASHPEYADSARNQPFDPDADGDAQGAMEPGLPAIIAALDFLKQHAQHKLVVAGHTDTTGPDTLNDALSDARARSVVALLEGDRDAFVKAAKQFPTVDSDGAVLHYAAHKRGWSCDPVDVGNPSKREIRAFQSSYNQDFGADIGVDGVVGDETRGAYFDLFDATLADIAGDADQLTSLRQQVRYVDPSRKYLACGDHFPIENPEEKGFRSRLNRRVELLFFEPPDLPNLKDQDAASRIYAENLFTFELLQRGALAGADSDSPPPDQPPVAIVDEDAPPPGVGEPAEELVTSMAQLQPQGDTQDQYAFLEPFDAGFPAFGHQAYDDLPDDPGTAVA